MKSRRALEVNAGPSPIYTIAVVSIQGHLEGLPMRNRNSNRNRTNLLTLEGKE